MSISLFKCCCLVTKLCPTLCDPRNASLPYASLSLSLSPFTISSFTVPFTVSQSLFKLTSIESMMPSNHLILCHLLFLCCLLLLLPLIFPSIRVFSTELVLCITWPKYRSFSISPSNEYSELISFRIDWLELLAVQGIPKGLL